MDDWTELDKGTLVMTDAGAARTKLPLPPGRRVPYALDDEFFLLPDLQYESDDVVEAFISEQGLEDSSHLGQHLADVLCGAREKSDGYGGTYILEGDREHTLSELADAFNYYLEHDAFLDLSPQAD